MQREVFESKAALSALADQVFGEMESGGGGRNGSRITSKNGLISLPIKICGNLTLNVRR